MDDVSLKKEYLNYFIVVNLKRYLLAIILILFVGGSAQTPPKEQIGTAVSVMAKLIHEKYVFPEKGRKTASHLIDTYRSGAYDKIKNWKEFDLLATNTIRSFSGDGHMYVRYDPKTVKELSAVKKETGPGDISEKSLPILAAAMTFVGNTNALIIDLQNNGGGGSAIGNVFETYFLPKETPLLAFRTRDGQTRLAKTVPWLTAKKYDKPLFIMVTKGTFSAAKAFSYGLQKKAGLKWWDSHPAEVPT